MIKRYKIVSEEQFKDKLKKYGARAVYVDVQHKKNKPVYRCLLNLKRTQCFIPIYFAEKMLNEDI
jgi:ribosomal protein L44E